MTAPEGFWAPAAEAILRFHIWDRVFEGNILTFRRFVGAQTNLAHKALDYHAAPG